MFKNKAETLEFAEEFRELWKDLDVPTVICAPFTNLEILVDAFKDTNIKIGAQNVHFAYEGAYTGEISVSMLEEIGVEFCIVGHSERRQYFGETDETVNLKLKRLFMSTIRPILCVGESLAERDGGMAFDCVREQLEADLADIDAADIKNLVIAYEPIWAIGTGRTATPEQAEEMCAFIRKTLMEMFDEETANEVIIQYGGSVKPVNVMEIMSMENIDGALVGGASLKAKTFIDIIDF